MNNNQVTKVTRYFRRTVFSLGLSALVFSNCASPRSPMGGPKDSIPPSVIKSTPVLLATNYKGEKIRLEFDEFIQTQSLKKELLITPRLNTTYEIKEGAKYIEIKLDSALDENTTYTFNFQESIKDVTEKTPWEKNNFTFSTGAELDSMFLNGTIRNALTNIAIEKTVVGLYNTDDTVTLFNGPPLYFAKTDKNGVWSIPYIKIGNYLLYAFTDKNQNLIVDPRSDFATFVKDTIQLNQAYDSLRLSIVERDSRELEILKTLPSGKYFNVGFNKTIVDYSINDSTNSAIAYNLEKDRKTIRFYNVKKWLETDSIPVKLSAIDSLEQMIDSTFFVKFRESKRKFAPLEMEVNKRKKSAIDSNFYASIWFSKPIEKVNTDSIYFEIDSLNTLPLNKEKDFTWNKTKNKLEVRTILKIDSADIIYPDSTKFPDISKISLHMKTGSFISIENDTSSEISEKYTFVKPDTGGEITGRIITNYKSYFIQLLDSKNEIVDEVKNVSEYHFKNITPGKYQIRVLIDTNENGKWDMGNINKRISAEPVYFYSELIEVRTNWIREDNNLEF